MDKAIEGLADDLRVPIIGYYLQGRSQAEIAAELKVTQATISNRLRRGTEQLRERLVKAGVTLSVALLASLLSTNAVEAAPLTLTAALGKMALAGAATSSGTITTIGGMSAMKIAVIVLATVSVPDGCRDHRGPAEEPCGPDEPGDQPAGAGRRRGQEAGGPRPGERRYRGKSRREALRPNGDPEGLPLPLAANWNTGWDRGLSPKIQMELIEQGHYLLPWINLPPLWEQLMHPNMFETADGYRDKVVGYYQAPIQRMMKLKLPFTIDSTLAKIGRSMKKWEITPCPPDPGSADQLPWFLPASEDGVPFPSGRAWTFRKR